MNALQSLWTVSPDEMSQDAALSWRYFSDIFASIGVISAPVPRYPEWAARETHSRGLKDLMFNKSPAEVALAPF